MTLFTLVFYAIFARFREQACTFICPYGRLQSTIMDENTMVVAYDFKRGEQRGSLRRDQTFQKRRAAGLGDCVQCRQCVAVCPTGIDIRDGIQMDCVNCTACIDACDAVMDKVGNARGLIRFASLNSIQKGEPFRFTGRMKLYLAVLSALIALFLFLVLTRSDIETAFLRAPGSLFQITANGRVQNLYTIKIVNKTTHDIPADLKLEGVPGDLRIMGGSLVIPGAQIVQSSVLVEIDPKVLKEGKTALIVAVYAKDRGKVIQRINTVFLGPRRMENAKDSTLKDK